jgi:hypothetical protein
MIAFSIVIHVVIILIGITSLIYDYRKRNGTALSLFLGANTIFLLIFGIIPIALILNNFFIGKTDSYLIQTINYENEPYLIAGIIILIGYFFLLFGYFTSKPYIRTNYIYRISEKTIYYFGYGLLFISTAVTVLFSITLGGPINSFQYIQLIRSNNIIISGPLFLLLPLSISAFIIYLSKLLKSKKVITINTICLLLSFFNSIYYVVIFGGRLPIALFLLIIPMYLMDNKNKISLKNVIIVCILGLLVLNYGENLLDHLSGNFYQTKGILDNIPRLVTQFSFPYINVLKVQNFTYDSGEFRYFIDFISWIINYLPSSIADVIGLGSITPSYAVNTFNHHMFDQNNPVAGGIPTDIITFGYYQFSLPGVIIITFLFGKLLARFDRIFLNSKYDTFLSLAKIRVFQILSFYPMYADIEAFMRRRVDVVVLIIIIIIGICKEMKGNINE